MPFFRLETNLPKSKIPDDFVSETTKLLGTALGKPREYCVAAVIPDVKMSWGGTDGPCGVAKLLSIGKLGIQENKKYAASLYEHVEKSLGIPKDKLYIEFVDVGPANMGFNGTTFH
ncbi:UNVERIFIED_CONTAM: hypothetical protein PYX00_009370 [Menopon gallinae]|uniref:L-dopachrome isomerase n=1 Tax=Menopon gallinae TaxID=328185 RepID=A0AAW2HAZ7_9NEOP